MPQHFVGLGVSPGIAIGRVFLLPSDIPSASRRPIAAHQIDSECKRFETVCSRAKDEIRKLRNRVADEMGESYAAIFDAQMLIVDDPRLRTETLRGIRDQNCSAAWSLQRVVDGFMQRFEEIDDPYLRERGGDLSDVHRRLQRLLGDVAEPSADLPAGQWIVVAHSLGPSDAATLARQNVAGIVTDTGGPTSHTVILAHALSVPAVVGLHDISSAVEHGNPIIVDGTTGVVSLLPEQNEANAARLRSDALVREEIAAATVEPGPVATQDGIRILIRANIEFPHEVEVAKRNGAVGIGLYRSEFLFLARSPELPTEEEHYRTYREIVQLASPNPAVIRTLDLGGEKYFHEVLDRTEPNPVLGLRAVRLCLKRPDIFRPQLRGLLRAAVHGELQVMLPLVISSSEIRDVRKALHEEAHSLRRDGVPIRDDFPLGIMIEVPAAAVAADLLAPHCDFFSIGTNDLIQYALAVDRGNESVAHLYQPRHAGILRLLRSTVDAARASGIPVSICGEMASDPDSLELLLGLGLRELSVQPRSIARVRNRIQSLDSRQAGRRVQELLEDSALGEPRPYRIVR